MSAWELAVAPALIAIIACDPMVVDAFEPPPEPVAMVPLTCPPGSLKTEPGRCGCDVAEDDFDRDGTPDCVDRCPDNAGRAEPSGECGCSNFADTNACSELRAAVQHLYTFDGEGTAIVDALGSANGTLLHVADPPPTPLDTLQLNGRVTLDGGSYVDLPDGIISSLGDATFEAWLTWRGGDDWARIFDFGDNDGATQADGVTYLFLTPLNGFTGTMRVSYSIAGFDAETQTDGSIPMTAHAGPEDNELDHVAVVVDRTNASMRLYSNGVEIGFSDESLDLSAVRDVNNWLGRSNYYVDPPLSALLIEFRIYARALTPAQISASFEAGPGALD